MNYWWVLEVEAMDMTYNKLIELNITGYVMLDEMALFLKVGGALYDPEQYVATFMEDVLLKVMALYKTDSNSIPEETIRRNLLRIP